MKRKRNTWNGIVDTASAREELIMIRFAAVICPIVWLLVFATGVVRGAERSREQPQTIRIAYVSPVTTMAPIWIASEIGAYQREGLDARIIYIDASLNISPK
jgi:ABC-type nitrate/sulfonate/bicarbonate transport system substrate-binding protein